MKTRKSLKILLVIALVLSFCDGFFTYYELSMGAEELTPWLVPVQQIFGLNLWLLFHIAIYSFFGFVLLLARVKPKFKIAGIYIWLSVEILLVICHIYMLIMTYQIEKIAQNSI